MLESLFNKVAGLKKAHFFHDLAVNFNVCKIIRDFPVVLMVRLVN